MTTLRRILTTTALAAMASSVAMADSIISFSHNTPTQASPFTDTFTLANFNIALGALQSVTITLSYSTTGEVDIFNNTGSPQGFTNATSTIPLTVNGPGGLTQTVNAVATDPSGVANPGFNAFPGLTGTGTLTISVPSADFSLFETPPSASTDSFSVVGGSGMFSGSSVPFVFFSGSAVAGGTTTVTYDYTVPNTGTPEPTTMALMGGALVGLGLLGKRFKRS